MSPLIWRIFDLVSVPGLAYQVQFLSMSCQRCVLSLYSCLLPLVSHIAVSVWHATWHVWILSLSLASLAAKMPLRASLNVVEYLTLNK